MMRFSMEGPLGASLSGMERDGMVAELVLYARAAAILVERRLDAPRINGVWTVVEFVGRQARPQFESHLIGTPDEDQRHLYPAVTYEEARLGLRFGPWCATATPQLRPEGVWHAFWSDWPRAFNVAFPIFVLSARRFVTPERVKEAVEEHLDIAERVREMIAGISQVCGEIRTA